MDLDENDYPEIRDDVAKICEGFPGQYWRDLEDQSVEGSYPTEFVQALTESGYLAALIPEEFGGAGLPIRAGAVILETIHANGCSAAACHAQMYTMGTLLRHGSDEQKQKYMPGIASGELRMQGTDHHRKPEQRDSGRGNSLTEPLSEFAGGLGVDCTTQQPGK